MRDALRTALMVEGATPWTFGSITGVTRVWTRVEKLKSIALKVTRPLVEFALALPELELFLLEFEFLNALLASSYLVLVDRQVACCCECRGIRWETIHNRGYSLPWRQRFVGWLISRSDLGNTHR